MTQRQQLLADAEEADRRADAEAGRVETGEGTDLYAEYLRRKAQHLRHLAANRWSPEDDR